MSIVDFMFNPDYRERLFDKGTPATSVQEESEEQKLRRQRKFWRDYHLAQVRHELKILQSEIVYGFIEARAITQEIFESFLKRLGAKPWTFKILWEEFKKNNKL